MLVELVEHFPTLREVSHSIPNCNISRKYTCSFTGPDLGEGCSGVHPLPSLDDVRLSKISSILQKKAWTELRSSLHGAPPPGKNPGSAPAKVLFRL